MIYKNPSQAASLLAEKIRQSNLANPCLFYLNPTAVAFCQLVAKQLSLPLTFLPDQISSLPPNPNLIIIDDGSTRAVEYNESIDLVKKTSPTTNVTLAIPVIPASEKEILKNTADGLIYLHCEPLFFSVDQFYEQPN